MTANYRKQIGIAWAMGILVWVNFLAALISTYHFGYVDWATVAEMSAIAFPPLAFGAVAIYRLRTVKAKRRAQTEFRSLVEAGR